MTPGDPGAATTNPPGSSDGSRDTLDVLVIGGGINGTGIARDLAGRGWRVLLVEKDDLAAHTSSASTKLLHGGLRYLEHREFALVRKALHERDVLLHAAPHVSRPLRFLLPLDAGTRPAWLVRAGLLLYDLLASGSDLPRTESVDLSRHPAGAVLRDARGRAFAYSDGWTDDARLVVLNAIDARARGALVRTRTECVRLARGGTSWSATLRTRDGRMEEVRARAVVNAAGPWAETLLRGRVASYRGESPGARRLRLVKGSHIVVPRQFDHDLAYVFQSPDRRIVFAIPYERDFTLVGTTDVDVDGDPGAVAVSDDEIRYLCEQANRYFRRALRPADVVWSFCGVRPLLDDASASAASVSRDYVIETSSDAAPLLTVWGGKLTTYRALAEESAEAVGRMLGRDGTRWTHRAFLPGGNLVDWVSGAREGHGLFDAFLAEAARRYPWLHHDLLHRLARRHGTRIETLLAGARQGADLGMELAPGLFERELVHFRNEEWACSADDVLWRRTKTGLRVGEPERTRLGRWMEDRDAAATRGTGGDGPQDARDRTPPRGAGGAGHGAARGVPRE
ncbi:MAG: glycerol-3-phosphate dehydrogenase [Betaproteobacteria bacterium]|nr:glycerol-3-phosphate dehydrogenase [Betaproteobacteria bacterium]